MDMQEKIRENAELAVEKMRPVSGLAFDYDAESVEWVDGFINRQRERPEVGAEMIDAFVNVLGSYLGECIRRNYGGEWHADEYGWCIRFDEDNAVYPFSKTRKQLENGAEDSIYSFFTMIPIVFGEASPMLKGKPSPLTKRPQTS